MAQGSDGSALSLEDFVGSALDGAAWQGSGSDDDATPGSTDETQTPGAPPVEQPTDTDNAPALEGADETEETGAENAPVDPNAPPAPDESPDATDYEALVSQAPALSYRVNGQERSYEDLKVVPGGAIIAEDALSKLQTRLSERDSLYEKSQQQYQQYQALEQLTAWKTTGQDGKEQTLTGPQAIEAQRVELDRTRALLNTISAVFDNPEAFSQLVSAKQLPTGEWVALPDKTALNTLMTYAENSAIKAEWAVRQQFQHTATQASQPQQIDVASVAPSVVEHSAQQLGVTLSPEDKTFLSSMVPRFVRPATQEDVRETPTLRIGEPVVDAAFGQLIQQQASLRASTAKTVQNATTVSKENANKLAAAKLGKTVVQQHLRTTPQRREAPKDQRAQDANDAFSMMERAASGRF